jgi:hypothetical protein
MNKMETKEKKQELEKETLIALWNKACKETKDKNNFQVAGSDDSPFYILNADNVNNIMFTVSAIMQGPVDNPKYNYSANIVFGEFVEYARFDLDKSEFDSLVDLFVKQRESAIKTEINRIVENTEDKLLDMIKSCEV